MIAETAGYQRIKKTALNYVESMKIGPEIGLYKKEGCEDKPSLYGSYHALHIYDLFNEMGRFSDADIDKWAEVFQNKQHEYGYFTNHPDQKTVRNLRELDPVWHCTRGIIWTLRLLNRKPRYEFKFMEPFLDAKTLYDWVKSYDWSNPWAAGNQVLACATALFAMRDWFGYSEVDQVMAEGMYPALEELIDPKTGYWGTQFGASLPNGQFGTIHITPIYFAQKWPLLHLERNVDSTLACQLEDGSFWPGGSDCPDFDGAYMMANLYHMTDYRREDIEKAAAKYLAHALQHEASDGCGFLLHRKDSSPSDWQPRPHFIWEDGKEKVVEELRDDDPARTHIMLGSWFYPLSIALITKILPDCGYAGPYHFSADSLHVCNVKDFNLPL